MTTANDLIKGGVAGTPERLATGTEGQYLVGGSVFADGGSLKSSTITDDSDLTLANLVKGLLHTNKGTALTLTIRPQATIAYLADALLTINNIGAGSLTVQADTGVTINGSSGGSITLLQYQGGALIRVAENTWVMPNFEVNT
jgi:hypothetical protein